MVSIRVGVIVGGGGCGVAVVDIIGIVVNVVAIVCGGVTVVLVLHLMLMILLT